jgi:hypothetical protein
MTITLATPMRGPVDCTVESIVGLCAGSRCAYRSEQLAEFAGSLIRRTGEAGLRTSLIAGQIAHETDRFQYGGQVKPEQFNFAGLGATNDGAAGMWFRSIDDGVIAVCEHHLAYLGLDEPAGWPALDERYALARSLHGGQVVTIGDYTNGRWAYSSQYPVGSLENGYARAIVTLADSIAQEVGGVVGGNLDFLIDIRDRLRTSDAAGHGPNVTGVTPRRGAIQHYSATPWVPGTDFIEQMRAEAQYHVNKGWGDGGGAPYGDGIMYHIGVNPDTGEAYLMRDLEATLWHCGYWGNGGNDSGYAVHVPGDANLVLTPAGLAGLVRVHEALRARDGYGLAMVRGHQEVSPTACPGPLMEQFVKPYRAGSLAPPGIPAPPVGGPLLFDVKDKYTGDVVGVDGAFKRLYQSTPYAAQAFGIPVANEHHYQIFDAATGKMERASVVGQETDRVFLEYNPDPAVAGTWDATVLPRYLMYSFVGL